VIPLVRPARSGDWPSIRGLLEARRLPTGGAETHLPDFLVATSEPGGRMLGVAGLERYGSIGLLRSVAVADDQAGKGLGSTLVRALLERARESGVRDMFLLTTTAPEWFPRFGFAVTRREQLPEALNSSEELRGACPSSAVAMRAVLREGGDR
jgi:amino-acid N-acetyltransferase